MRRSGATIAALIAVLTAAIGAALGAAAQGAQPQVGLVLQFGDGRVVTRCVALPEEGMSGLDLLERSGLDLRLKVEGLGALVCGIGEEGCPRDDCLCRCRGGGADCVYWAYHQLAGDRWRYAATGPSDRRLAPGDVDGWAWGPGSLTSGKQPPLLTLEEICAVPPSPSPSPSPSAAAPAPSPSPGATATPPAAAGSTPPLRRSSTPAATRSRLPSATPAGVAGSRWTPLPAATARSSPTPIPTPVPGQSADPTWASQVRARMQLATLEAYATSLAGLEGTAVARGWGADEGASGAQTGLAPGPGREAMAAIASESAAADDADGAATPGPSTPASTGYHTPADVDRAAGGDPAAGGDAAATVTSAAGGAPDSPPPAGPAPWRRGAVPALLLLMVLGFAWWRGRGGVSRAG